MDPVSALLASNQSKIRSHQQSQADSLSQAAQEAAVPKIDIPPTWVDENLRDLFAVAPALALQLHTIQVFEKILKAIEALKPPVA